MHSKAKLLCPYFADPHLWPREYPIPSSSYPDIKQMLGTKYVRTSKVTCFSPSVHFCLVLESLCGCILAWVSIFSLPNFPYILVGLWSILHFQCLFWRFSELENQLFAIMPVADFFLAMEEMTGSSWETFWCLSPLFSGLFLIALPLQTYREDIFLVLLWKILCRDKKANLNDSPAALITSGHWCMVERKWNVEWWLFPCSFLTVSLLLGLSDLK